jgi:serine/threonine-protein kinase
MIDFTTLGTVDLRRDGEELRNVLLQPKRLAVLAYLVTAAPRGFHSRDTVLGLFWPDLDQERARNAMRQALHFLRKAVGEEVLTSRGDRDIGVAPGTLTCDAVRFDEALAAGRLDEAVGLYRGDFLRGLFVDEAPEAERWLEAERARRRQEVLDALRTLVEQEEARGEARASVVWARRAVAIAPTDDGAVRRLMAALDRAGEPVAALDAYDQLVHRLREEFGVPPSGETIRLVNEIRNRPAEAATSSASRSGEAASATAASLPNTLPPTPAATATTPAAATATATPRGSRRWLAGAALVAMLAAGTFALRRPAAPEAEPVAPGSIAVLPFANMSGDPANDFLSDGFTEEVLNALANIDGLSVAARTSSFRFKGVDAPVDSIARVLHVRHVLEGSVRKDGDRLRVTAQLIDASSGFHLWSETYDRTTSDLFAVQGDISRAIALRLRTGVAADTAKPETRDPEAHVKYLRARQLDRRGPAYRDSVRTLLEEVIARDPSYARPRALLALWYAYEAYARRVPVEAGYDRARQEADRSIVMRETPEAHLALARIAQVRDWDFARAERHYARAVEIAPSYAGAYGAWALNLVRLGRGDEAVAVVQRGVALDPLSTSVQNAAGAVYALLGRYEEAIASYRAAIALVPNEPAFQINLASAQADAGDSTGALATIAQAETLAPDAGIVRTTRAYVDARVGRTASARALLAELERDSTASPVTVASAYAVLGDREKTLAMLERAAAVRDEYLADLMAVREFAPYRGDPRFVAIRKQLGL